MFVVRDRERERGGERERERGERDREREKDASPSLFNNSVERIGDLWSKLKQIIIGSNNILGVLTPDLNRNHNVTELRIDL